MKRALVVSVGGSKGSYAVGIIQYYHSIGRTYDIQIGSSTGALITTMVASGNIDKLAEAYTNISHKDIFKISPFKIKKSKNGFHKYSINTFNSLYNMFWKKSASLGDSSTLREKTIPKFFKQSDYNKIILDNKDLNICVSNLTLEKGEVKNILSYNYEQFCLSENTEILTDKGFLGINELTENDLIVSYKDNNLIYEKSERIIRKDFKGKMIHFDGDNFECLVTPNHKMGFFRNSSVRTNEGRKSRWIWDIKTSDHFLNIGKTSIKSNYKFPVSGNFQNKKYDISEYEIKFIGWMITEGWVKRDKKYPNNYDYGVAQSYKIYPENTEKLTKVIKSLPLLDYNLNETDGIRRFMFRRKSREFIESLFDGKEIKRIPRYILSNCSDHQLGILFESMMDGDGCWSRMTFGTKFIGLAEDFQELCHKIGRVGKISKTSNYKGDFFLVYVMKKDTPRHIRKVNEIEYDGKVWCVTVPSGFIVTKYNNKISVVGNCDWIWASTCAPPFMSIPEIEGYEYIDGGIMEMVPIEEAILRGADEIDVIILEREYPEIANIEKVRNVLHFIIKTMNMMMNKIKKQNVNLGALSHIAKKEVRINFHYTERRLTNNSLIFDREVMSRWREEGFESAKKGMVKSYILNGVDNTYRLVID